MELIVICLVDGNEQADQAAKEEIQQAETTLSLMNAEVPWKAVSNYTYKLTKLLPRTSKPASKKLAAYANECTEL